MNAMNKDDAAIEVLTNQIKSIEQIRDKLKDNTRGIELVESLEHDTSDVTGAMLRIYHENGTNSELHPTKMFFDEILMPTLVQLKIKMKEENARIIERCTIGAFPIAGGQADD